MYMLFFLAVERYWFRQLYHRLDSSPSLESMSEDYTQHRFLSVAQISFKKIFRVSHDDGQHSSQTHSQCGKPLCTTSG